MRKVGIVGASGLLGQELVRILLGHPEAKLSFLYSRQHAGKPLGDALPHFSGLSDLSFAPTLDSAAIRDLDAVFLALPHGETAPILESLGLADAQSGGPLVIDLSHDHRANDAFAYGLPELFLGRIQESRRIANPGCFATAAILSAAPLLDCPDLEPYLTFSAITGSSGAGITPSATTHHPFRDENVFAYKLFAHQHEPEILRALHAVGRVKPSVSLVAHSGPFVRGIHCATIARFTRAQDPTHWARVFDDYYRDRPFVRVRSASPNLRDVVGSNFIDVHVACRGRDLLVTAVLDNLVKGASGQAVQNFNLAVRRPQTEGLWKAPTFI